MPVLVGPLVFAPIVIVVNASFGAIVAAGSGIGVLAGLVAGDRACDELTAALTARTEVNRNSLRVGRALVSMPLYLFFLALGSAVVGGFFGEAWLVIVAVSGICSVGTFGGSSSIQLIRGIRSMQAATGKTVTCGQGGRISDFVFRLE